MSATVSRQNAAVVVVLGPTGSGKTELALTLATHLHGEIVNCDSIQVYRGFNIGSAKLPIERRQGIPHHLLDVIGPNEELSAGSYARTARQVITEIHQRRRVPIVVGGTGFYLRALLDGLSPAPGRDQNLRDRLQQTETRRQGILHRFLRLYDAAAASRIHPNDTPKLIRAVEIMLLTGAPTTQAQSVPREAFSGIVALKLGLAPERKALYSRLNERSAWMFRTGLIEETKRLLESGYTCRSKPMQSLGYKQALQFISGEYSLESALAECQAKTRQYAKRQLTWFRAEQEVLWLHGFGTDQAIQEAALEKSLTLQEQI
jgi:tRNA dimethylallyltransferase